MMKYTILGVLMVASLAGTARAACTATDAMTKASDVSEALMAKLQSKPDEAGKLMTEMGEATGTGAVNDATCVKLDALLVRAKKL